MKKYFTIISFLIVSMGNAQTKEQTFLSGNEFYTQKNYTEALSQYQVLADSGWISTSLYYNIGNCYYRLGKTGLSILYYEKALKLSPQDPDIRQNLKLAETGKIDILNEVPAPVFKRIWHSIMNLLLPKSWIIFGLIFLFAGSVLLLIFLRQKARSTLSFSLYLFCGVAGIVLLFIGYQKYQFDINEVYGVVIVSNTYVKSEPTSGQDLFIIHEGCKGKIEEHYNEWTKIRLSDGKSGWILSESIISI